MIFDRHPECKQKGNRHFWAKGYYVNTVGRNEEEIKKYIKNQVDIPLAYIAIICSSISPEY